MRITKLITTGKNNALILNQIFSTIPERNVWRSVWRICMWILGLKGLNKSHKEVATVEVAISGGLTVFHPG